MENIEYCQCSADGRDIYITKYYKYVCLLCGKFINENTENLENNTIKIK